ncbi:urease accessory protein UreF [Pseudorhodoferax sp. Leaf267]|uniref:urease accessory protein UreF n=1 Tax=Pseudorhodoferax sp. Leaf267 TaxID=1736316 RepID=UPI0006F26347|nr:urease accessory UreF family protein [Pseudorhodoferax sp. Leaf267]KQP17998.1 urease accessory protein UreF [Pseudorhodoferax sp. Leaf267]
MSATRAAAPAATLLGLIWLASPALPIGGFSYSEGLEAAVDAGHAGNAQQAGDWIVDQLHLAFARSDLAVVGAALQAWGADDRAELAALDLWLRSTRESAEFVLQTEQMGRSMLEWIKLHHADAADAFAGLTPCYPIAYAFAAHRTGATPHDACLAFAFGWAENMVAAAVKAVPLGQSDGQRMLGRLALEIPAAVDQALALPPDARQSFSPMLAILSSRHETQYSRLFRS